MSAQEWRKYYLTSTHAPLAGRDLSTYARYIAGIDISTHAPLAGRDDSVAAEVQGVKISTHAPLVGRDQSFAWSC